MQEFERLGDAFAKLSAAVTECAHALGAAVIATAEILVKSNIAFVADYVAAYNAAEQERPEWVHRAKYSKRKRIRKKYHDRIMRQYGRD